MADLVLLQIDDDDAAFFLLEIALREIDAKVKLHRVADGEQALAFLTRSAPYQNAPRPELILLDLNLPKKSGTEVLSALKSNPSLQSIPVIMLSSSSRPVDKDTSLSLGAEEYITKPPTFARFVEAVRKIYSARESHQ
jgi:CheY-like chemotaxis protein